MADYAAEQDDDFTDIGDGPPFLVPHFGSRQFTPGSPCPHPKAGYKPGEPFYCPRCDISGRDHYAYFRRPLKTRKAKPVEGEEEPGARPKAVEVAAVAHLPAKPLPAKGTAKETRKERRARMFACGHASDEHADPTPTSDPTPDDQRAA